MYLSCHTTPCMVSLIIILKLFILFVNSGRGGEDDEVPLLSEKFPDIYPLGGYADPKVLAAVNGLHGELNGGGEDMPCKHEVGPAVSPVKPGLRTPQCCTCPAKRILSQNAQLLDFSATYLLPLILAETSPSAIVLECFVE